MILNEGPVLFIIYTERGTFTRHKYVMIAGARIQSNPIVRLAINVKIPGFDTIIEISTQPALMWSVNPQITRLTKQYHECRKRPSRPIQGRTKKHNPRYLFKPLCGSITVIEIMLHGVKRYQTSHAVCHDIDMLVILLS